MLRSLWVFLVVLVAWPTWAAAKPTRVVLGVIQGDDDGTVLAAVKSSINSDLVVVGKREATKAEDKLKLSEELTEKEIKKLIKAVDADAVIKGTLDSGDTMALHIKIYLRAGTKPKAFTLSFRDSTSDKFRATLRKTILSKLGVVEAPDAPAAEDPADDPPVKPKKPKKDAADAGDDAGGDDAPRPKKPKKPAADDSAAAGDDSGGDDAAPRPKKPKKKKVAADDDDASATDDAEVDVAVTRPSASSGHAANRDAVRVEVGPSVTSRSLTFASRAFAEAPKPYKNGAVPGAHVDGEIYPLAFSNPNGAAAGLGFAFDYDKTLSLTLRSVADDGTTVSAPAKQQVYSFGPRYRIVFGQKVTSPSLTLGISYGAREFEVTGLASAMRATIDIPDIKYTAVQPGIGLRVPLAPAVALTLDARAVLVTDAGPIQLATQYGQAKVTGGQATAGIDIVISSRIAVQIVGTYAQFGFAFVGNGAMTNDRDGDPSSADIGGAADRYIGGAATLAVIY